MLSYCKELCFLLPVRGSTSKARARVYPSYDVGTHTLEPATIHELPKSPKLSRTSSSGTSRLRRRANLRSWGRGIRVGAFLRGRCLCALDRYRETIDRCAACAACRASRSCRVSRCQGGRGGPCDTSRRHCRANDIVTRQPAPLAPTRCGHFTRRSTCGRSVTPNRSSCNDAVMLSRQRAL
jgi:hypothetical protein